MKPLINDDCDLGTMLAIERQYNQTLQYITSRLSAQPRSVFLPFEITASEHQLLSYLRQLLEEARHRYYTRNRPTP